MGNLSLKITDQVKHLSGTNEVGKTYTDAQKQKLASAAKQFESLLTSMMLKSMTKTTDGMFGDNSMGGDYFDTIFQNEIANFISEKKSIGVADMLYKKLTGEDMQTLPGGAGTMPELNIKIRNNSSGISPVAPSKTSSQRLERFDGIIDKAAETFGVDKNLIKSVIMTESAANDRAVSSAKAKGLMQLIDSTAKDMGVNNVWDPQQNIFGGTKYLAGLLRKYNGDLNLALASYNAGPDNVDKYGGVPPFEETQNYVTRVKGYLKHFNGAGDGNE